MFIKYCFFFFNFKVYPLEKSQHFEDQKKEAVLFNEHPEPAWRSGGCCVNYRRPGGPVRLDVGEGEGMVEEDWKHTNNILTYVWYLYFIAVKKGQFSWIFNSKTR